MGDISQASSDHNPITAILWDNFLRWRSNKYPLPLFFGTQKSILKVGLKNAKGFPLMLFSERNSCSHHLTAVVYQERSCSHFFTLGIHVFKIYSRK